jgi:RNA polymerase sigma factor (sigma-70 family)
MNVVLLKRPAPDDALDDAAMVRACLKGDPDSWAALINKYKRLIFSIPIKFGASPDDAAEIFQAVCADLVAELPKLRRPESLKPWLLSVAHHKAMKWKTRARRESTWQQADDVERELPVQDADAPRVLEEVEREQALREAVMRLPDRCREMIRLLFYEQPPLAYAEVARRLGLATGSIGFIRGRCLKKLQANLEDTGF